MSLGDRGVFQLVKEVTLSVFCYSSVAPVLANLFACCVRLITKIAEKLGFMKVRALEVCTKAEISRKTRHIKPRSCASFQQGGFESVIP